jgi:hypothetical protein
MTLLHFFKIFKRVFHRLDVLPIDTRDHITVSQAQFAENGIGLYAGIGYSGELTVFEGRSYGCGFQQLILKENYGFLGVSGIFGPCSLSKQTTNRFKKLRPFQV